MEVTFVASLSTLRRELNLGLDSTQSSIKQQELLCTRVNHCTRLQKEANTISLRDSQSRTRILTHNTFIFTFPAQYCSKPLKNNSPVALRRLILSETCRLCLWTPGHLTGKVAKSTLVSSLILLTVLGSIGPWLPGLIQAFGGMFLSPTAVAMGNCSPSISSSTSNAALCPPSSTDVASTTPNFAGAERLPDLSLPKTVLSSVDNLVGAGGVVQSSSQAGIWTPLVPTSNNFSIIGTNTTGTFVSRTMHVDAGPFSGVLTIVYQTASAGPLKWDLQFQSSASADFRLVYTWLNVSDIHSLSSGSSSFSVSYPDANYTFFWGDVPKSLTSSASTILNQFRFSINLGWMSSGAVIRIDPSLVDSGNASFATAYGLQRRVFFEPKGGYYFAFYFDSANETEVYRYSHDGLNWSPKQPLPPGWPAPTGLGCFISHDSCLTTVYSTGQTVLIAAGTRSGPSPYVASLVLFNRKYCRSKYYLGEHSNRCHLFININ